MGAACTSNQKVSQNVIQRRRNTNQNQNFPNYQSNNTTNAQNQRTNNNNSRPPRSQQHIQQQQQQEIQQKKRSKSLQVNKPIQCFSIDKFKLDELELQEKNLICCICLQVVKYAVQDTCGHIFGKACIHRWVKKSGYCPFSRKSLTIQDLKPNMPKREEVYYAIKDQYKKVPDDKKKEEKSKQEEQMKNEEIQRQKQRRQSEFRRKSLEPQQRRRQSIMGASNQTTITQYQRNLQSQYNQNGDNNNSVNNESIEQENEQQQQNINQNQNQQMVECP